MDILNRILDLLSVRNKEQQQLADYLGLTKSAVTDWKKNKSRSYLKYITQIASFFEVPVDTFYCDDEHYDKYKNGILLHSKDISNQNIFDTTALELIRLYNTLSLKDKARALAYISELAENSGVSL